MVDTKIPHGMMALDADEVYKKEKQVFVGNEGIVESAGVECIICEETFSKEEMKYCAFDEAYVCPSCCSHCTYDECGSCTWPAD